MPSVPVQPLEAAIFSARAMIRPARGWSKGVTDPENPNADSPSALIVVRLRQSPGHYHRLPRSRHLRGSPPQPAGGNKEYSVRDAHCFSSSASRITAFRHPPAPRGFAITGYSPSAAIRGAGTLGSSKKCCMSSLSRNRLPYPGECRTEGQETSGLRPLMFRSRDQMNSCGTSGPQSREDRRDLQISSGPGCTEQSSSAKWSTTQPHNRPVQPTAPHGAWKNRQRGPGLSQLLRLLPGL